jgi:hypothetical protein
MRINTAITCLVVSSCAACADTILIPQRAGTTGGSGAYSTILNSGARSYMLVIGTPELDGRLPVGAQITALSWRLASWQVFASWPAGISTFQNFDIYMAQAAVTPGNLQLADVTNNIGTGLLQVRSGPITFGPAYFSGGALSPDFNPQCVPIQLETPYTYTGGPLLLMVRHTGSGAGNGNLDWVSSSFGASGAQAIAVSSYTSNVSWGGGGNGGAIVVELTFTSGPAPCYANCDQSTTQPVLNVADFTCFLQRFAAGDSYANCDQSTTEPVLNVGDFTCFLQRFAAGCR